MPGYRFIFLLLLCVVLVKGQSDGRLQGKVMDGASRQRIAEATITLMEAADSLVGNFPRVLASSRLNQLAHK
jgi:hypothetical protein